MFLGAEDHFYAWLLTLALPDLPLSVRAYRSATSTHETTPNEIDLPLSLSGVNYWAHRFRLRQHSDARSHLSDSTRHGSAVAEMMTMLLNNLVPDTRRAWAYNTSHHSIAIIITPTPTKLAHQML